MKMMPNGDCVLARPIHLKVFKLGVKGGFCDWKIRFDFYSQAGNLIVAAMVFPPVVLKFLFSFATSQRYPTGADNRLCSK